MATNVAVHITAAPQFTPVYGGGVPLVNGFNKRQDLTFFSCGFECYPGDFCQGYRSSYGVCCGTTVLTREEYNFCAPATDCVDYSVSSFNTYSYDSTRSIQYCGSDLPHCATYIWTADSFTNIFCADTVSGVYTYDSTSSSPGPLATFIGRTSTSADDETTTARTSVPSATVISNTRTLSSPSSTPTDGGGGSPEPEQSGSTSTSGLSTGATAGIAVGAAVGGIGLAIGAFFLWKRNRNPKPPIQGTDGFPPQQPPPPMQQNPSYNDTNQQYPPQPPFSPPPQTGVTPTGEFYNKYPAQPPANQPVYYELGGGDAHTPLMAQLPDGGAQQKGVQTPYQENMVPQAQTQAPGHYRQELQG